MEWPSKQVQLRSLVQALASRLYLCSRRRRPGRPAREFNGVCGVPVRPCCDSSALPPEHEMRIQVVRPAGRFRETAIKLNDYIVLHSTARFLFARLGRVVFQAWSFDIFKQNRPMTCYEKKVSKLKTRLEMKRHIPSVSF